MYVYKYKKIPFITIKDIHNFNILVILKPKFHSSRLKQSNSGVEGGTVW